MSAVYEWVNHGDVTLEEGSTFIKKGGQDCYYVLKIVKDDDTGDLILYDLYVDVTDDWINWVEVELVCGPSMDGIDRVLNVVEYYSWMEFGSIENFKTIEELKINLLSRGVFG